MTSLPLFFRKERRPELTGLFDRIGMGGGFFDGADETGMGAAAAEYAL